MSLLEYKNKFTIANPKKNSDIIESNFFGWTSSNFYRTSYNDMGSRVSNLDKYLNIFFITEPCREKECSHPRLQGFCPRYKKWYTYWQEIYRID